MAHAIVDGTATGLWRGGKAPSGVTVTAGDGFVLVTGPDGLALERAMTRAAREVDYSTPVDKAPAVSDLEAVKREATRIEEVARTRTPVEAPTRAR